MMRKRKKGKGIGWQIKGDGNNRGREGERDR